MGVPGLVFMLFVLFLKLPILSGKDLDKGGKKWTLNPWPIDTCVCVYTHTGSNMNIFVDLKPSLRLVSEADMQ